MQLVIWLAVCIAIVLLSGKRTAIPIYITVTLWLTIPWAASNLFTGVPLLSGAIPSMHAGTWLALVLFVLRALTPDSRMIEAMNPHPIAFFVLFFYVAWAVVVTVASSGGVRGVPSILYSLLIPILFVVVVRAEYIKNPGIAMALRKLLLWIATGQAILGVAQFVLGDMLLFKSSYASYYWWHEDFARSMGTTDHPLVLSMFLASMIPFAITSSKPLARVFLPLLFVAAILPTGSRTGLIVAIGIILFYVLASKIALGARVFLAAVLAPGAWLLLSGRIFAGTLDRFADDSGSTRTRFLAYELFGEIWDDHLFIGVGAARNYEILQEAGLNTSFESVGLIFAIDFGVLPTLLFYAATVALALVVRRGYIRVVAGSGVAFVASFVLYNSFSGGAVQTAAGSTLWILVALSSLVAPIVKSAKDEAQRAQFEMKK